MAAGRPAGQGTFTPRLTQFQNAPIAWRAFAFYVGVVTYSLTAALVIGRDGTGSFTLPSGKWPERSIAKLSQKEAR